MGIKCGYEPACLMWVQRCFVNCVVGSGGVSARCFVNELNLI